MLVYNKKNRILQSEIDFYQVCKRKGSLRPALPNKGLIALDNNKHP